MGKHGPCYHCGVTSTPLWRNGPPDKPVLCNACGSRWRTKGTLANYTPLHSRMDPDDYEDQKACKVKIISIDKNKEGKTLKQKHNHENMVVGMVISDQSHGFRKTMDEDISNRSSSGSALSNSESCAQFGSAEASDLTGPAQSVVWDSTVPSKKRTCVGRPKQSSVEKLTKDLYTILHEQRSSYFSGSSEEDLLFETEKPMVSVEIGHGSVLIRHPSSIAREEESEASSLSVDNKYYSVNEMDSNSLTLNHHNNNKNVNFLTPGTRRMKNPAGKEVHQEQVKRDKSHHEKLLVLGNRNSPLCDIDLNDVLNLEEFTRQLTSEEQQQLMKYLPLVDAAECPDSLKDMFDSSQFKENFTSFQRLLAEGIFDNSFSGPKIEDCKTLRRFALFDLTKSKWVERYNLLKKCKNSSRLSIVSDDNSMALSNIIGMKRSRDSQSKKFPEMKAIMKSSKTVAVKSDLGVGDNDGFCFSPRTLFAVPPDGSSLVLETLNFAEDSSEQDLLLEVRPNNSFPRAELLHLSSSFGAQQASTCSSSTYSHIARQ